MKAEHSIRDVPFLSCIGYDRERNKIKMLLEEFNMDIQEAIKTRRSIGKFTEVVPEKSTIESILDAAIWAPNHYKTEPWRFQVMTGKGREKLGQVYGAIDAETLEADSEEGRAAFEKGFKKAFRAPVIIAISAEITEDDRVVPVEEIMSAACAAQNMQLMAHSLGLASIWRTGAATYHEFMKEAFAHSESTQILGFLYLGFPAKTKEAPAKRPLSDVVTWVEA